MTAATELNYATLTEHNEWEGETWHFYVPIAGNEDALGQLAAALGGLESSWAGEPEDSPYELDMEPVPESEVDVLVKRGGDTDYMAAHNKLAGRLVLSDEALGKLRAGDVDPLYKGRIADYMQAATP
jgi:hypothetical protein